MAFSGYCAKGHDRVDFTGRPEAFEAHMVEAHGARKLVPGGRPPRQHMMSWYRCAPAPGWAAGKIAKPYQWKAPKPSAGSWRRVLDAAQAGQVEIAEDEM